MFLRSHVAVLLVWLWCLPLAAAEPAAAVATPTERLWDLTSAQTGWLRRSYTQGSVEKTEPVSIVPATDGAPGEQWLDLPVTLPGDNEFVLPVTASWAGWGRLTVEMIAPADLPGSAELYLFTKDWDHLWRQVRLPFPSTRGSRALVEVPIAGAAATALWESRGHQRPWHVLTSAQIREFGCRVCLRSGAGDSFTGRVLLTGAWLHQPVTAAASAPRIACLGFLPDKPCVGQLCEFSLQIDAAYADPFDQNQVRVEAQVSGPEGTNETVPGFYYEDFLFSGGEIGGPLVPSGPPGFRIRYTPRRPGRHEVTVRVRTPGGEAAAPAMSLHVAPPAATYHGFVRVDAHDTRHFAYDDGTAFAGVGLNVRSPYDTRYVATVPYSHWRDEGLALYARLFDTFQRNGINVVEVWMASWWLALEWINDAPGNHGVGYFNQYRAWMLDLILRWAEDKGIYMFLVFNNHGKFGALNDTEWARNPFNVKNGGYLESCEEYFSDPRAKGAFRKLADYALARWAYSPRVLAWKLFTEIDLTGTTYDFYQKPVVSEWHKEMAGYVKQQDLYRHLITTHWMISYQRINDAVADLPELDLLTTDAYYLSGSTREMLELLHGTAAFAVQKKKPVLVTEFGGSPHADSMGNLIKQAHLGAWTGFFCASPMTPMFWWFALVDEKGLYGSYRALDRFGRDEDRRGMTSSAEELAGPGLFLNLLRNDSRVLVWGYDSTYYLSSAEDLEPREIQDFQLTLAQLTPGEYDVEYWDCGAGEVLKRDTVTVTARTAPLQLAIPAFRGDFALKLRLRPRSE